MAASRIQAKYAALSESYMLRPVALEPLDPINESAAQFLNELRHEITSLSLSLPMIRRDNSSSKTLSLCRDSTFLLCESFESDNDLDV